MPNQIETAVKKGEAPKQGDAIGELVFEVAALEGEERGARGHQFMGQTGRTVTDAMTQGLNTANTEAQ